MGYWFEVQSSVTCRLTWVILEDHTGSIFSYHICCSLHFSRLQKILLILREIVWGSTSSVNDCLELRVRCREVCCSINSTHSGKVFTFKICYCWITASYALYSKTFIFLKYKCVSMRSNVRAQKLSLLVLMGSLWHFPALFQTKMLLSLFLLFPFKASLHK